MPSYETEKYEFYPADKYHLIVDSIEEVESNYGGRVTEQLRVKFFIKGGDYDDKPVSFWCGRGKGVAYISLWGAFGIDAVGRTLNTDKLYGKECDALIGIAPKKDGSGDKQTVLLIAKPFRSSGTATSATQPDGRLAAEPDPIDAIDPDLVGASEGDPFEDN